MGDGFLVQKLPFMPFYVSNHNLCFAQVITLIFPLCFPFKFEWFLWWDLFSTVAFISYFSVILNLLSFNFPWYFPEKSGILCFIFRCISLNIQWILFVSTFLVELFFELSNYIHYLFVICSFIYSLFHWLLSRYYPISWAV